MRVSATACPAPLSILTHPPHPTDPRSGWHSTPAAPLRALPSRRACHGTLPSYSTHALALHARPQGLDAGIFLKAAVLLAQLGTGCGEPVALTIGFWNTENLGPSKMARPYVRSNLLEILCPSRPPVNDPPPPLPPLARVLGLHYHCVALCISGRHAQPKTCKARSRSHSVHRRHHSPARSPARPADSPNRHICRTIASYAAPTAAAYYFNV